MIVVLRLGHRPERDKRVTTHVALTARAFGADGIIIASEEDEKVKESVEDVVKRWGGPFFIEFNRNWRKVMKEFTGVKVHLTMYGLHVDDVIEELKEKLKKGEDFMIIVGAEKVPREVYELADYNVAIGNQPHSEVAALAVLLDRLLEGKGLKKEFKGAKIKIVPQARGKKVVEVQGYAEQDKAEGKATPGKNWENSGFTGDNP
ncbi:tRNA (cytidine(56)-2'-O)-methyltransferase [Pyrococcus horikoshii]|uniref:tRNA (cytidine(56)-2'-O)-methyltransferase n=2 Tax=Pyrococcus horikoshii TaxID=53953 RepID=TRM56_PYRHO|nr:tRNA (cytidine(56)-2'-O)-methyltransferase [Pyrococcus horikoshii]O58214.2 RecName: Full=tRNA (cytidine(56)-2'-O)-methyltransferase; AltName: Full=tRNA ribose 2'-O-methyltransferase aTrm56 [Pyrococcus horikoshii OT3]HII60955.1 tRNA (cytidine(56)-2'-O)-methyltransferase [Pyrococcus horikoshii]